jgi:ABC-type dipeptide/oligopeptide/nickel transport system permease subunit
MLFAGLIAPHDPSQLRLADQRLPPFWVDGEYGGGSAKYLLGTDELGRDILSRLIHGVGRTLRVAAFPILCAGLLGVVLGIISGYRGGWVAATLSLSENVIVYLPAAFIMTLLIPAVGLGLWPLFIAVVLLLYPHYAGRARVATVAAQAQGTRALPNALRSAIVPTTTGIGLVMILAATTNFLGMGVPAPNAELGRMVADGRALIVDAWWVLLFPALAIVLVVLSVNLLVNRLRDRLDPMQRWM